MKNIFVVFLLFSSCIDRNRTGYEVKDVPRTSESDAAQIVVGSRTENIAIIGSGTAGLTAAIYAARAYLAPVVIGGQPGGQLATTDLVENYPGFPEGVKGRDLMDKIQTQATRFGTRFVNGLVTSITKKTDNTFELVVDSGVKFSTKAVVIATGASPKWLNLPNIKNTQGVSACAVCDGRFYTSLEVGVVGGGNVALEEALYMARIATKVSIYVRGGSIDGEEIVIAKVKNNPKIQVKYNTEVVGLLTDATESLSGVLVKDAAGQHEEKVSGLFMGIGLLPNTSFLGGLVPLKDGYIITQGGSTETTIPGIYAAGDVEYGQQRQGVIAAGRGADAAIRAEKYLQGL